MIGKRRAGVHTYLGIRVDSYNAAVGIAINVNLRTSVPHDGSADDPVFTPELRLEIAGTSTYPEDRAGDRYEIVVYGDRTEKDQPRLEDIHVRDEHHVPLYRNYRGQQYPVYRPPLGLAVLEKTRGKKSWQLCVFVVSHVARDMLTVLAAARSLYLFIHEYKSDRRRWVQTLTLQTTDPANE